MLTRDLNTVLMVFAIKNADVDPNDLPPVDDNELFNLTEFIQDSKAEKIATLIELYDRIRNQED